MTTLADAAKELAGVAKPIAEAGAKLIENLLGEPCKVAGAMLSDQIYAWQWRNRVRIAARAKQIMDEQTTAEKVLPTGFLLTLVEEAGKVEDPDLQELWSRLLANGAADDAAQHPAFIDALKKMSPEDARTLKKLGEQRVGYPFTLPPEQVAADYVATIGRLAAFGLVEARPTTHHPPRVPVGFSTSVSFKATIKIQDAVSRFGIQFLNALRETKTT